MNFYAFQFAKISSLFHLFILEITINVQTIATALFIANIYGRVLFSISVKSKFL